MSRHNLSRDVAKNLSKNLDMAALGSTADTPAYPLRRCAALSPRIIAIGASTGGLQALSTLLTGVAPFMSHVSVVVVLHMPTGFTEVIAEQVARLSGLPTQAAVNGEELNRGHIYFAPSAVHLKVLRIGGSYALAHSHAPSENFCKPAVDVLFRSVAETFGAGALGVVLTGMGSDGLEGARKIVEAGGSIIVQDEASSVVWGMPGAVARAGLASAIAPIATMAETISRRFVGTYGAAK